MICASFLAHHRVAVIDVDTQAHFFDPGSPVCLRNAPRVLRNIQRVLHWAAAHRVPVLSTVQVPAAYRRLARDWIGDEPEGRKAPGTLLRRRLVIPARDRVDGASLPWRRIDQVIVQKRCYDPFQEPAADRLLTGLVADLTLVIGAPVEGALKATTLGLLLRGRTVVVLADAVGRWDRDTAHTAWAQLRAKEALQVRPSRWVTAASERRLRLPV